MGVQISDLGSWGFGDESFDGISTVREAQEALGIKVDGVAGKDTAKAVREFQEDWNRENPGDKIKVDGVLGRDTYARLEKNVNYKNVVTAPTPGSAVVVIPPAPSGTSYATQTSVLAPKAKEKAKFDAEGSGEGDSGNAGSFIARHGRKIAIGIAVAAGGLALILIFKGRHPKVAGLGSYGGRKRRRHRR
jgi:hypothetical protein